MSIRSMDAKIDNRKLKKTSQRSFGDLELESLNISIKEGIKELLQDEMFRDLVQIKKDRHEIIGVLVEALKG